MKLYTCGVDAINGVNQINRVRHVETQLLWNIAVLVSYTSRQLPYSISGTGGSTRLASIVNIIDDD